MLSIIACNSLLQCIAKANGFGDWKFDFKQFSYLFSKYYPNSYHQCRTPKAQKCKYIKTLAMDNLAGDEQLYQPHGKST